MSRILPFKSHSSKKCTRKWLWNPEPRATSLCGNLCQWICQGDKASTTPGSLNGVISVREFPAAWKFTGELFLLLWSFCVTLEDPWAYIFFKMLWGHLLGWYLRLGRLPKDLKANWWPLTFASAFFFFSSSTSHGQWTGSRWEVALPGLNSVPGHHRHEGCSWTCRNIALPPSFAFPCRLTSKNK